MVVPALLLLAAACSFLRFRLEGWFKPALVLVAAGILLGLPSHLIPGLPVRIALALILLVAVAVPTRHARLTHRARKVVRQLTGGLPLDLHVEVIRLRSVQDHFLREGGDPAQARHFINAYAGEEEGLPFVAFTPAAAALSIEELSFVAAHEVGHHVLGHCRPGFLDKVGAFLESTAGKVLAWPLGNVWKHVVAPRRSQSHEFDADEWAVRRLRQLRKEARGAATFLDRFARMESDSFLDRLNTKLFGSHPPSRERMARIQKLLKA